MTGLSLLLGTIVADAAQLKAGIAKVNITRKDINRLINDSLYARILVLDNKLESLVIISLDTRAMGEKGGVGINFTERLRNKIQNQLKIDGNNVMITATGVSGEKFICTDIEERIFNAVRNAYQNLVPVNIGVGIGKENKITENRRLKLTNGKEWTIRHASPLPPDEEVAGIGPVDPEIGILRLDKKNGNPLAILYNFAVHPYQGVPNNGLTADVPAFSSRVIENNLPAGTMAIFLQGSLGDISTVLYKDVNSPRDAEALGNKLGISVLTSLKSINTSKNSELKGIREVIEIPSRTDISERIASLEKEQEKLLRSLKGTSLNFKTFFPLYITYSIFEEYPSYYSHRYLREKMTDSKDLENLDKENLRNLDKYLRNIYAMEKLTRIQNNLSILMEQQERLATKIGKTIDFEIQCLKIGDMVLVTFPGEPVAQIGLNIKELSPFPNTFVTAYSNGDVGYSPTAEQYKTHALEDTYCIMAPEWQYIYEQKVKKILTNF
ncbi:hypothetical protein [Mariniphaga sediminis]|uniref:hypothetical protein n=1 Tax=Mariniphaga sediminis TaxID=1628158 RepID=UPI0019D49AF7|nr:hypothetical protein [Mariniphaga sediminis]